MTQAHKTTQANSRTPAGTKAQKAAQQRPRKGAAGAATPESEAAANDVRLVGRLSADPIRVELPSGDVLLTVRISVPREPAGGASPPRQRTDSVPCTVWAARVRRSVASWRAGDLVEVAGSVRCRFYQAGGATRSRVEVEVSSGRIIRRSSAA